jgi:uncharacterized protein
MDEAYDPIDPRGWLARALSCLRYAEGAPVGVHPADIAFQAHQAVEKAIKAVFIARNVAYPYSHDLKRLLDVLEASGEALPEGLRDSHVLTPYAGDKRYPDRLPDGDVRPERAVALARLAYAWAAPIVQASGAPPRRIHEPPARPYPSARRGEGIAPDPALLDEVVRRIVAAAAPDRIILFGSAARGDMARHSDLDVLVVKAGDYDPRELETVIRDALGRIPTPVDVVLATPEWIERYGHHFALVYAPALTEGRVLYERTA